MSYEWPEYYRPEVVQGARGSGRLSSYSIAVEAWRRGLQVTFTHPWIRNFQVSDGAKSIEFEYSRPTSLTSQETYRSIQDKYQASLALKDAGVASPNTIPFDAAKNTFADVADAAETSGYPVVLKPQSGSRGLGVLANILDRDELKAAHDWLVNTFRARHFILEKFYEGGDHRVYVAGTTFIAAGLKIPAHVVGDGVRTISQLIAQKNRRRRNNPFQATALIKRDYEVDDYVAKAGLEYSSVPPIGAHVRLRGKANVSAGGDFEDRTNSLPQHIKDAAVKSVAAFPGLTAAGVDVLYDPSKPQGEDYVVIELNSRAHIALNMYPNYGTGPDVPSMLIDYYFPQSQRLNVPYLKDLRINLDETVAPLRGRSVEAVLVSPIPEHGLPSRKKVSLDGLDSLTTSRRKRILSLAGKNSISGSLTLTSGILVAAGRGESVEAFCEQLMSITGASASTSADWEGTIEIGFSIR